MSILEYCIILLCATLVGIKGSIFLKQNDDDVQGLVYTVRKIEGVRAHFWLNQLVASTLVRWYARRTEFLK